MFFATEYLAQENREFPFVRAGSLMKRIEKKTEIESRVMIERYTKAKTKLVSVP